MTRATLKRQVRDAYAAMLVVRHLQRRPLPLWRRAWNWVKYACTMAVAVVRGRK
jgi:hypothetical protein